MGTAGSSLEKVLLSSLRAGVCAHRALPNTRGTREGLCPGRRGLTAWSTESQGPGLGFNLLLSVQALRVRELSHTLADGDLGATAIEVVQVHPGLLGDLPVVSSCRVQGAAAQAGVALAGATALAVGGALGAPGPKEGGRGGQPWAPVPNYKWESWDFPGESPSPEDPRRHICGCSASFPGVGVMQKVQAGEAAEGAEGVGREQRGWGTHAEAKHLDHSAQVLGLDLDGCGSLTWGEEGSWEELEARRWQEGAPRSQEGHPASWEEAGAGLSLTLLQLDVAASFDLCDPAVVNGPRGLWNRHG